MSALSFDELVRVVACFGLAGGSLWLIWFATAVAGRASRRREELLSSSVARVDEVMPREDEAWSRFGRETHIHIDVFADPGHRQALYASALAAESARTRVLPAAELSAFDEPPALPPATPGRRDDRGQLGVGLGFLVMFVVGLLIFSYVQDHGVGEAFEDGNRCGQAGMRALVDSDADEFDACTDPSAEGTAGKRWGSTSPSGLRKALARVELVDERPEVDGYEREEFGPDWTDEYEGPAGGNDCDTRNDVLAAQLRDVRREDDGCVVVSGTLADPYTGRAIRFDREADPSAVQVDHVVPLSVAWDMGASEWSEEERTAFANDAAHNLVASDGPANMAKSDHPPAEWLPPNSAARCEYLRRYLAVSDRYELPVTEADAAVVRAQAHRCARGGHGGAS